MFRASKQRIEDFFIKQRNIRKMNVFLFAERVIKKDANKESEQYGVTLSINVNYQ